MSTPRWPFPSRRAGRAGGAASRLATLAVLVLAAGVAVVALGGGGGGHEHAGAHAHGPDAADPVLAELRTILATRGMPAALDRLEELGVPAGDGRARLHQYVHELARSSYTPGGDVRAAFAACDARFTGGCYHGVLQAYLQSRPAPSPAELNRMCDDVLLPPDAVGLLRYHCIHGLGHGLARTHGLHDGPLAALGACDALADVEDALVCGGGALMEQYVHPERGAPFTCTGVPERYLGPCFNGWSAAALRAAGGDVRAGFAACDAVPRPYVGDCYRGMGRDISTLSGGDPDEAGRLCELGTGLMRVSCHGGVAAQLSRLHLRIDEAVRFCAAAPPVARTYCFEVVGGSAAGFHAPAERRDGDCARVPGEWVDACRRGAGLPSPS